jgi:hypothetical protein
MEQTRRVFLTAVCKKGRPGFRECRPVRGGYPQSGVDSDSEMSDRAIGGAFETLSTFWFVGLLPHRPKHMQAIRVRAGDSNPATIPLEEASHDPA